jgi:pimeloyl-ACP methyl ester carboxylesterase
VAERLRPGDHLCGHSYGAVVSLFAAEVARDLRSLTVIEPPAFGLATDDPQVAAYAERQKEYWAAGSCGSCSDQLATRAWARVRRSRKADLIQLSGLYAPESSWTRTEPSALKTSRRVASGKVALRRPV